MSCVACVKGFNFAALNVVRSRGWINVDHTKGVLVWNTGTYNRS